MGDAAKTSARSARTRITLTARRSCKLCAGLALIDVNFADMLRVENGAAVTGGVTLTVLCSCVDASEVGDG